MERLLKLSLSIACLLLLFSCSTKREKAEAIYKRAIQYPQGSRMSINGIKRATEVDSTYEQAVYELSVAYLKRGLPHEWLPQYNKAVKLDAATRIPWRGYLYLWFYRDYRKAIADFDASDTLTPDFIDAPQGHSVDYWRGVAYLGLKDYKKSNAYFEKHIAKEIKDFGEDYVDVTAFLYNGISYFEAGNYEKALANFDKQLAYSRNLSADAKYYKAQIFKAQNLLKLSKTTINQSIADYNLGYNNKRPYVETLRQIYPEDLEEFKKTL
ncbi:tetratricopeptide repeat protein [Lacinutrix sp. Hel_I_90]|uniref:tetratricopeptide repeat protein n=1 Tax=Lacinutrix sp. Hel_I_90 TaxID=1249999 RepID=UPI0005C9D691|nr:tetratricopeptide repeat protein [Lacinutrix sp. Hel_I_90]